MHIRFEYHPEILQLKSHTKKKENKTWSKEHFSYIKKLYVNTFGMLELQLFQHALCCFIVCSTTVWQPTSRLLPSAHKAERETNQPTLWIQHLVFMLERTSYKVNNTQQLHFPTMLIIYICFTAAWKIVILTSELRENPIR